MKYYIPLILGIMLLSCGGGKSASAIDWNADAQVYTWHGTLYGHECIVVQPGGSVGSGAGITCKW